MIDRNDASDYWMAIFVLLNVENNNKSNMPTSAPIIALNRNIHLQKNVICVIYLEHCIMDKTPQGDYKILQHCSIKEWIKIACGMMMYSTVP